MSARNTLAMVAAAVMALALAGGAFLGWSKTTKAGPAFAVSSFPGNPPSNVAGGGQFLDSADCDGDTIATDPCVVGSVQVGWAGAFTNLMAFVYTEPNCPLAGQKALLLDTPSDPLLMILGIVPIQPLT